MNNYVDKHVQTYIISCGKKMLFPQAIYYNYLFLCITKNTIHTLYFIQVLFKGVIKSSLRIYTLYTPLIELKY
ncbi:hypothetical protein MNBD_CPR01-484 [hydrothermal vent metagenome]|uniref:Uncharacterized protein n=1 Tax=hydrothermal vent metagenome TaxID=652676 RepID=A0A3B0URW6_9ZZZZ